MATVTAELPIERLTAGTLIKVPGFGPAEVYEVLFDGEGYDIHYARSASGGWDDLDTLYVKAGETVQFDGLGDPALRPDTAITAEEWEAKYQANMTEISRLIEVQNQRAASWRELAEMLQVAS